MLLSSIAQSIPIFLCYADSLNEAVLKHLARIGRLQLDEEEAVLALRNVLQELLDLVGRVVAADFLNDGFALQSVGQRRPNEQASEIDSDDVGQRSELLRGDPKVPPKVA